MIPERLPSARRERTTTMRVIDLSEEALTQIANLSDNLRRLDLSNLRMDMLPEECLENLVNLERLDISNNELTEEGFPETMISLEKLVELTAENNELTEIPKVVRRMKGLLRLKLSHNALKSVEGIEKLKKLVFLIIDNNEIDAINKDFYSAMKRLEMFHCANNRIKDMPSDVRHMRHLRDLDVSNNQLSTLPSELFLLPRIDVINASSNNIIRLPSIVIKDRNKRRLAYIDLSGKGVQGKFL